MARSVRHRPCTRLFRCEDETARSVSNKLVGLLIMMLLGIFAAAASLASTASSHKPVESPYVQAEHARQMLETRPEDQRTLRDYERVLELYRAIYHDDPASPKADASIFAVAQLLAE